MDWVDPRALLTGQYANWRIGVDHTPIRGVHSALTATWCVPDSAEHHQIAFAGPVSLHRAGLRARVLDGLLKTDRWRQAFDSLPSHNWGIVPFITGFGSVRRRRWL